MRSGSTCVVPAEWPVCAQTPKCLRRWSAHPAGRDSELDSWRMKLRSPPRFAGDRGLRIVVHWSAQKEGTGNTPEEKSKHLNSAGAWAFPWSGSLVAAGEPANKIGFPLPVWLAVRI